MDNYHHTKSPVWKQIWIMFDLSNGDSKGRTYFWSFGTKKEALEFRKETHKNPASARLSHPIKVSANTTKK